MTVIASFALARVPIVFADLLLTGPQGDKRAPTAVPVVGNVQDFFGDSGWGIGGLRQKITVLSPGCVVAWAGSYVGARVAISGLEELAKRGALSPSEITNYLAHQPELKNHPASFVGFTRASDGVHQFCFGAEQFDSPTLGTVYASGTGTPAIHEFSALLKGLEWRFTGEANARQQTVATTLTLGGLLLQSEFRGGNAASTLLHMFGGGYEIATWENGGFQKLEEVTYVFWDAAARPDGAVALSHPRLIVKQQYVREHLLIKAVHVEANGSKLNIKDDQRHLIGSMIPATSDPTPDELSATSLQSKLFCHCILLGQGGMPSAVYTIVQRSERAEDAKMIVKDHGAEVVVSIHRDLITMIGNSLKAILNNSPRITAETKGEGGSAARPSAWKPWST